VVMIRPSDIFDIANLVSLHLARSKIRLKLLLIYHSYSFSVVAVDP